MARGAIHVVGGRTDERAGRMTAPTDDALETTLRDFYDTANGPADRLHAAGKAINLLRLRAATPQAGVPREPVAELSNADLSKRLREMSTHILTAAQLHGAVLIHIAITMNEAAKRVAAAPAPLDDARDSERLDWLELTIRDGSYQSIIHDIAAFCQHAYKHFGKGPAIRTAIDTARAAIAKD